MTTYRYYILFGMFFIKYTATTEIYTLSLHDALPISRKLDGDGVFADPAGHPFCLVRRPEWAPLILRDGCPARSEEHTSELQSRRDLVCRLLLEKKKYVYKHNESTVHLAMSSHSEQSP